MSLFPHEPVSPREFIEEIIPAYFAEMDFDEQADSLDLKLGIKLEGEGGGEWKLHLIEGELGIAVGVSSDCALTVLQTVVDWKAGLWEGRPGLVADAVDQIKSGGLSAQGTKGAAAAPSNPEALRELESLPGRIDAIVEGVDAPDWCIGVHIGPGPIAETPNATLRIGADEAEALRRGDLHPLEALITGQLRLEGDLGLILQLQAIAMAASMSPPSGK
jgi:hypothetical protein